jgi:uncharacterized membrane protein YfcA
MDVLHAAIVFVAALIAGMINSVAGGGTLVSFPALVWVGVDPIKANATNAFALWPGSFGGAFGFRRELEGSRQWLLLLIWPSLVGGAIGAFLLLRTPSRIFAGIVPYLILGATLLLAAQETITRRLYRAGNPHPVQLSRKWSSGAIFFQFLVAIYGGYFGAGIGILMLAALGLLGLTDIHRMNAIKNLLALLINGIATIYFVVSGYIVWADALLMAVGAIAGGYGGAGLARRLGRRVVRGAAIAIGFGMAISLLLRH